MSEYQQIIRAVDSLGLLRATPTVGQTTGGRHSARSKHYQGTAVDFGQALQGGQAGIAAIYRALLPHAIGPGAPVDELFYADQAYKNGQRIGAVAGHDNHVHVGVRPGVDLAAVVAGRGSARPGVGTAPQLVPVGGSVPAGTSTSTPDRGGESGLGRLALLTEQGTWVRVVQVVGGLGMVIAGGWLLQANTVKAAVRTVSGAVPGAVAGKVVTAAPRAVAAAL